MNIEKSYVEAGRKIERKIWGTEFYVVNKDYCGKLFEILPMSQSSLHRHIFKSETFLCLEGLIQVELEGETHILRGWAKDCVDIPAGSWHRFSNFEATSALMVEFSTHHKNDDVERLEESRRF
jgi:mannose-6-phosphate isomerase-like protein (cupin superfamily)